MAPPEEARRARAGTTVLFLHGLESGPHGDKVKRLRAAGLTVRAVQMPCSPKAMALHPTALLSMAAGLALDAAGWAWGGVWGLVGAVLLGLMTVPAGVVFQLRRAWKGSLAVQRAELARGGVDAVVGSSYGGAVAVALLHEGTWTGPTVLLCPAWLKLAMRARMPVPPTLAQLPAERAARVVVVHGTRDEVVPLGDSERLVAGSAATLVVVEDGHRLASVGTPEALAGWVSRAMGS